MRPYRFAPPFALSFALLACIPALAPADPGPRSGPYRLQVVDEDGRELPTFCLDGRTYVQGELGQRYLLRVRNDSGRRVEVVASVDGRDVVDGRPASLAKRGYLVGPREELLVDGFRISAEAVAAFRFSSVPRSYAARTGDARDVGVVGVAIFPERPPRRLAPAGPPYPFLDESAGAARDEARPEAGQSAKAAPAPSGAEARSASRPGLGTEFGEEHRSQVERVAFERERAQPAAVLTLRYDDRSGLASIGIDVDGRVARRDEAFLRGTARPFPAGRDYAEPPPGWRP